MDTDLHAVIRANILEPVHKQFILYQVLKALKICHEADLIHRDLKPSNLLLNEECLCKVADFGLARSLRALKQGEESASVLTDYVATRWCVFAAQASRSWWLSEAGLPPPWSELARTPTACRYRAPEIMLGSTSYTKAVDMCAAVHALMGSATGLSGGRRCACAPQRQPACFRGCAA
jgi:mitogen-activated protein kinase 15